MTSFMHNMKRITLYENIHFKINTPIAKYE